MVRVGILAGPTASGKSSLALEFCESGDPIEIINADSVIVYRYFDIGSAKPTQAERLRVPHHLVDVRAPHEVFTAGDFVREVNEAIEDIESRGKRALIVGGTGFYLKALIYGMWPESKSDPALRAKLEQLPNQELYEELLRADEDHARKIGGKDRYRLVRAVEALRLTGQPPSKLESQTAREPDPRFELWYIDRETQELEDRMRVRTRSMLKAGWIEEVEELLKRFPDCRPLQSVGYAQVLQYLTGRKPEGRKPAPGLQGLEDEIVLATRQMVKSQRTWFKGQLEPKRFILEKDALKLNEEMKRLFT